MATDLNELYNQVPAVAITGLTDSFMGSSSPEGPGAGAAPPKGFRPLSPKERMDWNNFVSYLNREAKVGGSEELDRRDRSMGLDLLKKYAKENEGFSITPEKVPWVQYEFQLLRDTGTLPNVPDQGYARTFLNWHGQELRKRPISEVDGWIGSLTSRQAYQEIQPIAQDPEKRYWGTDYVGATEFFQQLNDQRKPATVGR